MHEQDNERGMLDGLSGHIAVAEPFLETCSRREAGSCLKARIDMLESVQAGPSIVDNRGPGERPVPKRAGIGTHV